MAVQPYTLEGVDFTSLRFLQLEAYWGDIPLSVMRGGEEGTSSGSCKGSSNGGLVRVCQRSVDIELWLKDQLPKVLSTTDFALDSIVDYDVDFLEVCIPSSHPCPLPSSPWPLPFVIHVCVCRYLEMIVWCLSWWS